MLQVEGLRSRRQQRGVIKCFQAAGVGRGLGFPVGFGEPLQAAPTDHPTLQHYQPKHSLNSCEMLYLQNDRALLPVPFQFRLLRVGFLSGLSFGIIGCTTFDLFSILDLFSFSDLFRNGDLEL